MPCGTHSVNQSTCMKGLWFKVIAGSLVPLCCGWSQDISTTDTYGNTYPTRSEGPSIQYGQGFQSVAPSMPASREGQILVKPKVQRAEGVDASKEAIITSEIVGLVFLEKADQLKESGVPGLTGVVTGIAMLKREEFQAKLRPYFGRPASLSVLDKICRDVIEYYRRNGFPVVNVIVPRQTVRDGAIQFLVTEAKVGKVIV